MPSEDTKILQFNQNQKTNKTPFITYTDLESSIGKIDGCKNNSENHLQQKQVKVFHQVFQCLQYLHLNP